jgi:hypothetical protein
VSDTFNGVKVLEPQGRWGKGSAEITTVIKYLREAIERSKKNIKKNIEKILERKLRTCNLLQRDLAIV